MNARLADSTPRRDPNVVYRVFTGAGWEDKRMIPLPIGVALVAVKALKVLFFASDRLSIAEIRAAKILALYVLERGARAAVIGDSELARILDQVV